MGWVSTIEDSVDRLNGDFHLLGQEVADKGRQDVTTEARRLHTKCQAMLKQIRAVKELLAHPDVSVASKIIDLEADLAHERERNEGMSEMLEAERTKRKIAEAKVRSYEAAEQALARRESDVDEKGAVMQGLRQTLAKLRGTLQDKTAYISKQEALLAAAYARANKLQAKLASMGIGKYPPPVRTKPKAAPQPQMLRKAQANRKRVAKR